MTGEDLQNKLTEIENKGINLAKIEVVVNDSETAVFDIVETEYDTRRLNLYIGI